MITMLFKNSKDDFSKRLIQTYLFRNNNNTTITAKILIRQSNSNLDQLFHLLPLAFSQSPILNL